jgi:hypothetical protein
MGGSEEVVTDLLRSNEKQLPEMYRAVIYHCMTVLVAVTSCLTVPLTTSLT